MSSTQTVTLKESRSFAALSGDFNVQHLDPIYARRLLFGSSVIHGVHLVLLALDRAVARFVGRVCLRSIRVAFSGPAPTGSNLHFDVQEAPHGASTILIKFYGRTMVTIDVNWEEDPSAAARPGISDGLFAPTEPITRMIDDIKGYKGQVPLKANLATLRRMFPAVASKLAIDQIAILLATTHIVGMRCPGSDSIFAALNMQFTPPRHDLSPLLDFEVTQSRPALKLCAMKIAGPGVKGEIHAMFRPPVFNQPGMQEVRARVPRDSFVGQRVLIVGGSRGLGELSAKIVCAGGGETAITYARGKDDAERVASDICKNGDSGSASVFHLDVTQDSQVLPPAWARSSITHIYHFASPRIEPNRFGAFDQDLFALYCRFYVSGLERLLYRLLSGRTFPLTLFNPSTIYIDRPDIRFAEYAAAKVESERLCTNIHNAQPDVLKVFVPRLPRLRTDQTIGLQGEDTVDALDTLLATLPRTPDGAVAQRAMPRIPEAQ